MVVASTSRTMAAFYLIVIKSCRKTANSLFVAIGGKTTKHARTLPGFTQLCCFSTVGGGTVRCCRRSIEISTDAVLCPSVSMGTDLHNGLNCYCGSPRGTAGTDASFRRLAVVLQLNRRLCGSVELKFTVPFSALFTFSFSHFF